MDPEACLRHAQEAFDDRDYGLALMSLRDYAQWRFIQGFEPADGDRRFHKLMERAAIQMESLEQSSKGWTDVMNDPA